MFKIENWKKTKQNTQTNKTHPSDNDILFQLTSPGIQTGKSRLEEPLWKWRWRLCPGLLFVSQTLVSLWEESQQVMSEGTILTVNSWELIVSHPRAFGEIELSEHRFEAGYMSLITPSKPKPLSLVIVPFHSLPRMQL